VSLYSARSSSNSRNSPLLKCNFELDSWSCFRSKSGGVTSVTGSHCARGIHLSASGHDGHLLAFLDQCRGYAVSLRRRGLRVCFYQVIFYSELVPQSYHHYSHAGITWSLATTKLEGRGPASELHNDTSSDRRSVWRHISTVVLMARSISSPKMNSLVILVTKTQIHAVPESEIEKLISG
jgi:hypothetical protein